MKTRLFIISALFVLSACATPVIVNKADRITTDKAASFQVTKERSKVYIISGIIRDHGLIKFQYKVPTDIYINGKKIGAKNGNDVMVIEFKPGNYDFSWKARSAAPNTDKSHIFRKNLLAGEVTVLQQDFSPGGAGAGAAVGGLLGGLVGGVLDGSPGNFFVEVDINSAKSAISSGNVVVPQTCPSTVCLK